MKVYRAGETLTAPGVLQNPVLVEAMWDQGAANEAALRNLLNRAGYASVEAIREEGVELGVAQGVAQGVAEGEALEAARSVLAACEARGWTLPEETKKRVLACKDVSQSRAWLRRAITAASVEDALDPGGS